MPSIPATLIECLRAGPAAVALTGAGVSAASGVPTFRDAQTGLWARYRAEDLATPEAFLAHPERVWRWYAQRCDQLAGVRPNAAHEALAALGQRLASLSVVTQNVDDLHERAGSEDVVHLHGRLNRYRCMAQHPYTGPVSADRPPQCPRCGAWVRPDVVWFGEVLPQDAWNRALAQIRAARLALVVGTSARVYPAAALPELALSCGVPVCEINPEVTPLSAQADWSLRGHAELILPQIVAALGAA